MYVAPLKIRISFGGWGWAFRKRTWLVLLRSFPRRAFVRRYKRIFRERPDVENPRTFNEKVLWVLINDKAEDKRGLVDKYAVREFVEDRLGSKGYVPQLFGAVASAEEIDGIDLPDEFVMKPSHLSNAIKFIKGRQGCDRNELKRLARSWLKRNYVREGGGLQYAIDCPRIIFEEFLQVKGGVPDDYKFFCFDGAVQFIQVDRDRFIHHKRGIYDADLNLFLCQIGTYESLGRINRPENYEDMVKIAGRLAEGFDFVRVDLYNIEGRIVFGEMTFTPGGGIERFVPHEWDLKFGSYWKLDMSRSG